MVARLCLTVAGPAPSLARLRANFVNVAEVMEDNLTEMNSFESWASSCSICRRKGLIPARTSP